MQEGGKERCDSVVPGSGPGSQGYIHVRYARGGVQRQKKNDERTKGVLSDSIHGTISPARCCTSGAWTQFAVLKAARGCCAGDPSVGSSEIRCEVYRNMERTRMNVDARRWKRMEWRGVRRKGTHVDQVGGRRGCHVVERSHTLHAWYWSCVSACLPSLRVSFLPHNVLIHRNVSHSTICSMMGLPCHYTCKKLHNLLEPRYCTKGPILDVSLKQVEVATIVRFRAVQVNRKRMKKQRTLINHRSLSHWNSPTLSHPSTPSLSSVPQAAWIQKNHILFPPLPSNG